MHFMYKMTAVNIRPYRTAADFALLKQNKTVVLHHFAPASLSVGLADHNMGRTYYYPPILYHNVDRTLFPSSDMNSIKSYQFLINLHNSTPKNMIGQYLYTNKAL